MFTCLLSVDASPSRMAPKFSQIPFEAIFPKPPENGRGSIWVLWSSSWEWITREEWKSRTFYNLTQLMKAQYGPHLPSSGLSPTNVWQGLARLTPAPLPTPTRPSSGPVGHPFPAFPSSGGSPRQFPVGLSGLGKSSPQTKGFPGLGTGTGKVFPVPPPKVPDEFLVESGGDTGAKNDAGED